MNKLDEVTTKLIAELVEALVEGNFELLVEKGYMGRLTPEELGLAISEYGRTLCPLPSEAFAEIDIISVGNSSHNQLAVDIPLWTEEEGRSDLTLSLSVEDRSKSPLISIMDCHVL